jgi:hypothetical protein
MDRRNPVFPSASYDTTIRTATPDLLEAMHLTIHSLIPILSARLLYRTNMRSFIFAFCLSSIVAAVPIDLPVDLPPGFGLPHIEQAAQDSVGSIPGISGALSGAKELPGFGRILRRSLTEDATLESSWPRFDLCKSTRICFKRRQTLDQDHQTPTPTQNFVSTTSSPTDTTAVHTGQSETVSVDASAPYSNRTNSHDSSPVLGSPISSAPSIGSGHIAVPNDNSPQDYSPPVNGTGSSNTTNGLSPHEGHSSKFLAKPKDDQQDDDLNIGDLLTQHQEGTNLQTTGSGPNLAPATDISGSPQTRRRDVKPRTEDKRSDLVRDVSNVDVAAAGATINRRHTNGGHIATAASERISASRFAGLARERALVRVI